MKTTASKVLGMAAAIATGREDAMVAFGLLGKSNLRAWGKAQAELADVAREHGAALLVAQHEAAARKAQALAA